MQIKIRNAAGAAFFITGLPVMAQETTAAKVTTNCASCPPVPAVVHTPGGPTWLVAGLIIGGIVGYIAGKAAANKKKAQ